MCKHKYAKLGYLVIYTSEMGSFPFKSFEALGIKNCYSAHVNFASNITVYQCQKCGDIKFSNGILEKLFQDQSSTHS